MTAADLSCSGWTMNSRHLAEARFVVSGRVHAVSEIAGVLVRLPAISENELERIAVSDRRYVASEINAFLIYWLSSLPCPVLNRPSPRSLAGPGWYPEHWVHCAAAVGLNTRPIERAIRASSWDEPGWGDHGDQGIELTMVGEQCFGDAEPALVHKARRLAKASGADLVSFRFDGASATSRLLMADPFPRLDEKTVASAVLQYLTAGKPTP